jgi:hypothetical protein
MTGKRGNCICICGAGVEWWFDDAIVGKLEDGKYGV